LITQI